MLPFSFAIVLLLVVEHSPDGAITEGERLCKDFVAHFDYILVRFVC
jgi:hypothetical protein